MKRTCTSCGPQLLVLGLSCPTCGLPVGGAGLCSASAEDDALPQAGAGEQALLAEPAGPEEQDDPQGLAAHPLSDMPAYPSPLPPPLAVPPLPYRAGNGTPIPFTYPVRAAAAEFPHPHDQPGTWRGRVLHLIFGVMLLGLFYLPWAGARSWELLSVVQGASFVRQLLLLVAGVVLFSTAVLPVPPLFRGVIGLLLGSFGLSLGGVMLNPWQNLLASLAIILLPSSLVLVSWHSRAVPGLPTLRLARCLGLLGVLAVLSLYLVPRAGVMPISVIAGLLRFTQDDNARFLATYLLLPLPLLGFSMVALLSEDVAILGELLAGLLCSYGPGALLILLIDSTQAYVAAATLSYSLCAAYGFVAVLQRLSAPPGRDSLP